MKTVHYIDKNMSILESTGVCACGVYVSAEKFGDNVTHSRQKVTCGNCLRSKAYRQGRDLVKCTKCDRIVGQDYRGRKHKCNCGK